MAKILFYLHRASNLHHFMPLAHVFRQKSGWEIGVAYTPYDSDLKVGLPPDYEARLKKIGVPVIASPKAWTPDATLTFDSVEGILDGCGELIRLSGSLISKGVRYTNRAVGALDNMSDLYLLPGPWYEQTLRAGRRVSTPTAVVGYPSLDALYLPGAVPSRETYLQQLRIDPCLKTILFAPTWNVELSSVPHLWTRITRLATSDRVLFIRLHPYLSEEVKTAFRRKADEATNVVFVHDLDLIPYLQVSDLVVTDVSGIAMEMALLDKPVVFFDNPNQSEYPDYDPDAVELKFRGVGPCVRDLEGLERAVTEELHAPERHALARAQMQKELMPYSDGKSSLRVLYAVDAWLDGKLRRELKRPFAKPFVVIDGRGASEKTLQETLNSLTQLSGEPLQGAVLGTLKRELSTFVSVTEQELENAIPENSDLLVRVKAGVLGQRKWLTRLASHLRSETRWNAVVPLVKNGAPSQEAVVRLGCGEEEAESWDALDQDCRIERVAQSEPVMQRPHADVIAFRASSFPRKTQAEFLAGQISALSLDDIGLALDVVVDGGRGALLERSEGMLSVEDRNHAEERIAELSDWIGRILPVRASDSVSTSGELDKEIEGRLRLVLHYEAKGRLEQARSQLERILTDFPDHPELKALAERLR